MAWLATAVTANSGARRTRTTLAGATIALLLSACGVSSTAAPSLLSTSPGTSPEASRGSVAPTQPTPVGPSPAVLPTETVPPPLSAALLSPAASPSAVPGQPPPIEQPPTSSQPTAAPQATLPTGGGAPTSSASTTAASPATIPAVTSSPMPTTGPLAGLRLPEGHGADVSLSFDDGPSAKFTPQVLALLAAHHVTAVFCLIGVSAAEYPHLVAAELAGGHQLCDHSRDHDLHMDKKGAVYISAEVDDGLADIHKAVPDAPVRFYRQPGGLWSPEVLHAMSTAGLRPLRWTVDPRDWSKPGEHSIAQTIMQQLHPGGVILLHDGGGDRSQSVAVLSWLLDALPAAGWHVTLPTEAQLQRMDAAGIP